MYHRSAELYDDLYSFKNYDEMSQRLDDIVQQYRPNAQSLLEVACGTGQFLRRLQKKYLVEGVDLSSDMLRVAALHCPGVHLHQADMFDFSIPNRFDAVACLFSSISYATTFQRLQCAVEKMTEHLNPSGVLLIEPFFTPENCWDRSMRLISYDGEDRKVARMYVTRVEGKVAIADFHFLVGEPTGVEHFVERHEFGLFTDEQYRKAVENVGLSVAYDPFGLYGRGMYIGNAKQS